MDLVTGSENDKREQRSLPLRQRVVNKVLREGLQAPKGRAGRAHRHRDHSTSKAMRQPTASPSPVTLLPLSRGSVSPFQDPGGPWDHVRSMLWPPEMLTCPWSPATTRHTGALDTSPSHRPRQPQPRTQGARPTGRCAWGRRQPRLTLHQRE